MDIYIFNKSLQKRQSEFTSILSSRDEIVPASRIQSEWSYHVELVLEPVGWQALWKIPRLTCQDFGVHYPCIVKVEVEHTEFTDLSALVKIIAVQEEIHLPDKYDVPLIELYPIQKQENSAVAIDSTAECIDQLRFFYNYLWMPWDGNDDDTVDWVENHLELRLRLFFDMKRGDICKKTCDIIRTLMREGHDIQSKIGKLESEMSDDESDHNNIDEVKTCKLMKLHFRLQQIKNEMEVLENPEMREILVKNQSLIANEKEFKRRESRGRQIEAHFVWLGGSLEETLEVLNSTKKFLPSNIFMKTTNNLQEALESSHTGDIILVGNGEHQIKGSGNLEDGGTIKGLSSAEFTVVVPEETLPGPTLLDFSGNEIVLENLTIDLKELQAGIIVRKGTLKLINCRMVVFPQRVTKLGVIVLPGAKLIAINSQFIGLGTCIDIHNSGEAVLSECLFQQSGDGFQLNCNSKLKATNCTFSNISEYGIRVETENEYFSETKVGNLDLLGNINNILIENCKFNNVTKGVVSLRPSASMSLSSNEDMITS